ncbi:MAG: hypothetical protein JWL70_1719, partial [Acidimicrobiia bacterium]|nr:hypothetical protein [Acidimicrobiia bacterium]
CPSGCVIIDVHATPEVWRADLARSDAMFRDPIFRFSTEAFSFIDEQHEKPAISELERARDALSGHTFAQGATGDLKGRLVSFNRIPHLPDAVRADVWAALDEHKFASVMQLALKANGGDLLVDAYLNEDQLIDDFVAVERVLSEAGYPLVNEWYAFTDRAHERALDQLAFGLGLLPEPTE